MLFESLSFLVGEVNAYLNDKLGMTSDPRLMLGNTALAIDGGTAGAALANKAIMSLVNLEEDRATRTPTNRVKVADKVVYKSPPVLLNLYVLFSINRPEYTDCLKWLGHVLTFFQYQKRFTPSSHPNLDTRIEELSIELYTMNFEQVNHLWSTLGGKYLPSALYKVRQLAVDENAVRGEGNLITEVTFDGRAILPGEALR